tara:strand:- start:1492 stop:2031 length:540 start_codon:yes stop_codon:yes gene_type:complete
MKYPEHKDKLKDSIGRYRTLSLFREFYLHNRENGVEPIWCLKDEDPQGVLPSLKKLYMEIADPTEYQFAIEAFGNWQHWLKIKTARAINKIVEDWPIELEVKLRSDGIRVVAEEALNGRSKFNAAKFLAKGEWKDGATKRGRPSKEEVTRELKIASKLEEEIGEDATRLGLTLVSNTKQ